MCIHGIPLFSGGNSKLQPTFIIIHICETSLPTATPNKHGAISMSSKYTEDDYESRKINVTDFLPDMKFKTTQGDIQDVIQLRLKSQEMLVVVDALFALKFCPLCLAPVKEGSFVMITETHNVFPCWECGQLVIKTLDKGDEME